MATYGPRGNAMFAKARLDALTDGVFGVAMMLLVLDVRCLKISIPLTTASFCKAWPVCGRSSCPTC
jgi:uncharacterized membrane protein